MSVFGGAQGQRFVDRNDPAAADFSVGDFTTDGAWHDLDLSGILPADAGGSLVLCRVRVKDGLVDQHVQLRQKGLTNAFNLASLQTQEANVFVSGDLLVVCDSSRVIEYRAANTTFTEILLTVSGWWLGT